MPLKGVFCVAMGRCGLTTAIHGGHHPMRMSFTSSAIFLTLLTPKFVVVAMFVFFFTYD